MRAGLHLQTLNPPDSPYHAGRPLRATGLDVSACWRASAAPRTCFESKRTLSNFSEFGLSALILKALAQECYETPAPIQIQAIPTLMTGRDLCGIAQTGTGKTAAFALPILHRLAQAPRPRGAKGCRVVVLTPTRELASQIAESFSVYGRNLHLATTGVYCGVPLCKQEHALARRAAILVATPC